MNELVVDSLIVVAVLALALGILRLRKASFHGLMFGIIGAGLGLLLGALASVPLSKLPQPLGGILPVVVTVVLTITLMVVMISRRNTLRNLAPLARLDEAVVTSGTVSAPATAPAPVVPDAVEAPAPTTAPEPVTTELPPILVDTSVIIDGRIADIAAAGFVPGRLVVPRFVLAELQNIADSDDAMRRGRGRRGLDVLNNLRELPDVEVEIIEDDVSGIREVDAKLVALAQKFHCNVLTTDYNLNRVAQIQGVRVLNVNELSNAIRPVVLPGEELMVRVVQPGKERNQGVGYLADGTMIVVENGDKLIGQEIATEVTRVFQTVAGKMIFAVPRPSNSAKSGTPSGNKPGPTPTSAPNPAPADQSASGQRPSDKSGNSAHQDARKDRNGRGRKHNGNGQNNGQSNGQSIAPSNKPNPSNNSNPAASSRPGRIGDLENRLIATANEAAADTINPVQSKPN